MTQRAESSSNPAEAVRAACVKAALDAYEDAGIRGLCAEGRWEAALSAIRDLDLSGVLERPAGPVRDA
jgi:pentatricopeptide repeat protein